MNMTQNYRKLAVAVFAVLLLANFIYYFCTGWGLITVKVRNVPLAKVIKSIEWQTWWGLKIYTNLPADTKVSMYVDHVPLAEAMETLSLNCDVPRPADDPGAAGGATPPMAAASTATGNPDGTGRRRGGGGFGGGLGGGGGGVQWNLAFFAAPSSAQVKEEIRSFQEGGADDNARVYAYPTMLQMFDTDDSGTADPRLQNWPGMKPATAPVPQPDGTPAPPDPDAGTVQGYLKALAQGANIWIMAPTGWSAPVSNPPSPSSSISSAVKRLVSSARGTVVEAIILRGRTPRPAGRPGAGRGGVGFASEDTDWEDRARNAINGLPEGDRPAALAQLDDESQFRKTLKGYPADQIPTIRRKHRMDRMLNMADAAMSKMSPEKRAARFAAMVSARAAAKGH
jgi:hypothetical protein